MPMQLTTLTNQLMDWANRGDWSGTPGLTQSYVTFAEQKFNSDLRVSQMLTSSVNTVTQRCSTLPDDWLEMYLVSIATTYAPNGWSPIRYKSNDEFFNLRDWAAFGYYTIVGRAINFGGTPDNVEGIQYQIIYYAEVPPLNDTTDSWVYTKYPNMYLWECLRNAAFHAVGEEGPASNFGQMADAIITKLNNDWAKAKASGSRVTRTRTRSFG
jgi:hypothetical protein